MAEGVQLGSMFWTLGLESSLDADIAEAEVAVDEFEGSTNRASRSLLGFEGITTSSSRQVRMMGSGVAATGNALIMIGSASRDAEGGLAAMSQSAVSAGMAMTAVGAVTSATFPIMRAFAIAQNIGVVGSLRNFILATPAVVVSSKAISAATFEAATANSALAAAGLSVNPSLVAAAAAEEGATAAASSLGGMTAFAAASEMSLAGAGYMVNPSMIAAAEGEIIATQATVGLTVAMRGLMAATVIGAVIIGAYMLYEAFTESSRGAKELDKQMGEVREETDALRSVQTAYSQGLNESKTRVDELQRSYDDYSKAIEKANKDLERAKNLEQDLVDVALDLEEANLDLADAKEEYALAAATGDTEEERRAAIRLGRAQRRVDELKEGQEALGKEKEDLATQADLSDLLQTQARVATDLVQAQKDYVDWKMKEEEVSNRIRTNDFYLKLLEWQKAGIELTKEELDAFNEIPWMKAAMERMPKTVATADYKALENIPVYGPWAAGKYAESGVIQQFETNPLFKNAPESVTVHIEHLEVKNGETSKDVIKGALELGTNATQEGVPIV